MSEEAEGRTEQHGREGWDRNDSCGVRGVLSHVYLSRNSQSLRDLRVSKFTSSSTIPLIVIKIVQKNYRSEDRSIKSNLR